MKKTLQFTLVIGSCIAIALAGVLSYLRYDRPNLIANPHFDEPIDLRSNWHRIPFMEYEGLDIASEGDDKYAVVDTSGISLSERNPYMAHVFAQKQPISIGSERQLTLSGRIRLETKGAMGVVMLKASDINGRFISKVYRLETPDSQWSNFEISLVAESNLRLAEVILGVNGSGRAHFDDIDLVAGSRRGLESTVFFLYASIILICLAAGLALIEMLFAKQKAVIGKV